MQGAPHSRELAITRFALVVSFALAVAACGTIADMTTDVPYKVGRSYTVNGKRYVPRADPNYRAVGIASWYGWHFHGRRTASGRRFNMFALTAAHRTLPFGTRVRVTNLANRRSIVVTVNDRGPFARGRIIDVSRRAAGDLGFRRAGTARVRVEVVGAGKGRRQRTKR